MTTTHDDLRLTDAYRVKHGATGEVLSTHSTFRAALASAADSGRNEPQRTIDELIDGEWVQVS